MPDDFNIKGLPPTHMTGMHPNLNLLRSQNAPMAIPYQSSSDSSTSSTCPHAQQHDDDKGNDDDGWRAANVIKIWGEPVDFAVLVEEIPGGALLCEPFLCGSQGFVAPCLALQPCADVQQQRYFVRKVANLEYDPIEERAGQPSEIFFNRWLEGYSGKVDMTHVQDFQPGGNPLAQARVWSMHFPYVEGGSLVSWLHKLESPFRPDELLPPLFVWTMFRDVCRWLGFLKFGWQPGMDLEQTKPWHSICHGDLHQGNILLDFTRAQQRGGVPEFLLADLGYTRFGVEQRFNLSRKEPFDDIGEIKSFHSCLRHILQYHTDPSMAGAAEFRELIYKRYPNVYEFEPPPGVAKGSDSSSLDMVNSKGSIHINYDGVESVESPLKMWIDPYRYPQESFEELKTHNPMSYQMLTELLPVAERVITELMSDPSNHVKSVQYYRKLRESPMPGRPRFIKVTPGNRAPEYVGNIDGKWKWVAITKDNRVLGPIEEKYAPKTSYGTNMTTWEFTQQYD